MERGREKRGRREEGEGRERERDRASAHQTKKRKETNSTTITNIARRRKTPRTMAVTSSPALSATQKNKASGTFVMGRTHFLGTVPLPQITA